MSNREKLSESFGFIAAPETKSEEERLGNFVREVESETVRGMVLNITSFIDEQLITLLLSYFPNQQKAEKLLLEDMGGCLGTVMDRANIAHVLALITDSEFAWIRLIARIRNEFAHHWDGADFAQTKIIKLTSKLTHPVFDSHDASPRARFMFVAGELVQYLSRRNEYAIALREQMPENGLVDKIARMEPKRI